MLKNFWWGLGFSSEVSSQPKVFKALGQKLSVYRTPQKQLVILNDACPKCKGALSAGKSDGENNVCTCGAAYRPDGRSVSDDGTWVDAYPGWERYGWFWGFMGDLPAAERPPKPEMPYLAEPHWKRIEGKFAWNVHYARALENGADAAHAPFVHGGSFGNPDLPEIEEHTVEQQAYSARATIHMTPQRAKGLWSKLYKSEPRPVKTVVGWWMPNMSILEVHLPLGKLFLFNAHVPVDDDHTISHYIALRDFLKGGWADGDSHRRVIKIFSQDQKVVEAQRPELLPFDLGAELHVKADAIQIAFRQTRRIFFDKGWALHGRGMSDAVIPSPIRREMQHV